MKTVLEWGFALTAIGASMAFGGVQPLAYSLMQAGAFLFLLLLLFNQSRSGKKGRTATFTLAVALSSRRCIATGSASRVADNRGGVRSIVETSGSVKIWSSISCS
jgi:hypothetical protein